MEGEGSRMKAVVFWTCACDVKVKAVLTMGGTSVTVQCANPSCKATRTLPGQITQLWVESEQYVWRNVELNWLVHPDQQIPDREAIQQDRDEHETS